MTRLSSTSAMALAQLRRAAELGDLPDTVTLVRSLIYLPSNDLWLAFPPIR
jgi:hypothetical protein